MTKPETKTAQCVVIGGGLIGMMTARELALSGVPVTLLERGQVARESSWAGGGILSPLYPWRYADAITRLASWSQQHYPALLASLSETTGIDPQWIKSGLLILDAGEVPMARQWAERYQQSVEILNSEKLADLAPELSPELKRSQPTHNTGGLWLPEVAQVRNPRFGKALRTELSGLENVDIREHTEVLALRTGSGRVTGVETSKGLVSAEQVVIAAGAWSAALTPGLELPVVPVRGQMLLYKTPPGTISHIVLYQDRYLIPRRDGRVLVGSTLERVGFDKATTAVAREDLQQAAEAMAPALKACPIERHWSGLRPGSPDGIPYIGAHPLIEGLYLNTGHYRNGVVLGYASARLLADILLNRKKILDASRFDPKRLQIMSGDSAGGSGRDVGGAFGGVTTGIL